MDPTAQLCLIRGSFDDQPQLTPVPRFTLGSLPRNLQPVVKTIELKPTTNQEPRYVDAQLFQRIFDIKEQYGRYGSDEFNKARVKTNPFELIGKSGFVNRAAIKLSNIDAVFKLTGDKISYWNPIDFHRGRPDAHESRVCFADLAGGPGGFSEYLQYRWPMAYGFGITLKNASDPSLDWHKKIKRSCTADQGGFFILYGTDGSGNLYTQVDSFANQVLSTNTDGCAIVVADGSIDPRGQEFRQEFINSRLMLAQMYAALLISQPGGHFTIKMFDCVTKHSGQLLYLLSCCFEEMTPFKPSSSRYANSERYVVCKNRRAQIAPYVAIFKAAYDAYNENLYVDSLFDVSSMTAEDQQNYQLYEQWLTEVNNTLFENQLQYSQYLLEALKNPGATSEELSVPQFSLSKALVLWNLPDSKQQNIRYRYC